MCRQPQPNSNTTRLVTRPFSKLDRLCAEAASCCGKLTKAAAVAPVLGLSPTRVSQLFGSNQERDGTHIQAETVGKLARAFTADGVQCEVHWLYLEFDAFAHRLAEARADRSSTWVRTEATLLPDLVELRLNPPRPGNEVPDSHYVDATLLFGAADCDYDPEDGQDPRTVSIALRNARLSLGSESYRPLPGTMLGERVESANFRRVAGGIDIIGPAPEGTLEGAPLGDHYLAVIAGTNNGEDPFPVTIAANRRSFVVSDPDALARPEAANIPPNNKNAILNVLIYKDLKKDESGRVVLARATLKRRPRQPNSVS